MEPGPPGDSAYYREAWGFDPGRVRREAPAGSDLAYLLEDGFPLDAYGDEVLDALGFTLWARVEVDRDGGASNRLVLRAELGGHEATVSCVHLAVYEAPVDVLARLDERDQANLARSTEGVQIDLPPLEHFAALRSFASGLSEIGLEAVLATGGRNFGFNSLLTNQLRHARDDLLENCHVDSNLPPAAGSNRRTRATARSRPCGPPRPRGTGRDTRGGECPHSSVARSAAISHGFSSNCSRGNPLPPIDSSGFADRLTSRPKPMAVREVEVVPVSHAPSAKTPATLHSRTALSTSVGKARLPPTPSWVTNPARTAWVSMSTAACNLTHARSSGGGAWLAGTPSSRTPSTRRNPPPGPPGRRLPRGHPPGARVPRAPPGAAAAQWIPPRTGGAGWCRTGPAGRTARARPRAPPRAAPTGSARHPGECRELERRVRRPPGLPGSSPFSRARSSRQRANGLAYLVTSPRSASARLWAPQSRRAPSFPSSWCSSSSRCRRNGVI
ncbi:MAG: hypothetical protein ACTSU5_10510 [Promethearchaeota archaeon]